MRIQLNVQPFQETLYAGMCGPASLKIVLAYYGIERTENGLAQLCAVDSQLGVSDKDIKRVAEQCGLSVIVQNDATFDDLSSWLERGVPPIVNWFTRGRYDYPEDDVADGHYSVVTGLDDLHIYLQDPEIGRIRKITRDDFMRVWFDFTGVCATPDTMILRQAIAIYHE